MCICMPPTQIIPFLKYPLYYATGSCTIIIIFSVSFLASQRAFMAIGYQALAILTMPALFGCAPFQEGDS